MKPKARCPSVAGTTKEAGRSRDLHKSPGMLNQIRIMSCFLVILLVSGCGSRFQETISADGGVTGPPSNVAVFSVVAAEGADLTHTADSHRVVVPQNGLTQDTEVQLTLFPADSLTLRKADEFVPVGRALTFDISAGSLNGQLTFHLPFQTDQPEAHRLYWHVPGSLAIPLETQFDHATSRFVATIDLSSPVVAQVAQQGGATPNDSFTLSVVDESGFLSRPAHQPWPSYNLYVFRNGSFQKVVNQGTPSGLFPDPGENPLMIVHGLGSDIPRFNDAAAFLQQNGNFSTIWGFEYDTLSGLVTTGPKLFQAYAMVEDNPESQWRHLAHSMGCLVSRTAFESDGARPYSQNTVVFAAGPHLGSEAINVLEGSLSLFQQFARYLVVNEVMDFANADGTPCQVDVNDPGFKDLAVNSPTLNALNDGAADRHPKEFYRTLGGNDPGLEYDAADYILGVDLDDGLVDLTSANPGTLIGSLDSAVVPESHSSIVEDTENSLPVILNFLNGN